MLLGDPSMKHCQVVFSELGERGNCTEPEAIKPDPVHQYIQFMFADCERTRTL